MLPMEIIKLNSLDLAWSWGIILIAVGLSRWQQLGLEGQFLLAAGRSLIQLLFIGYLLEFIFALNNPWAVLLIVVLMITIAAIVARNRIGKKIKGLLKVVWGGTFARQFIDCRL